ncbi:MAG: elongation factor G [Candidatus Stahlbacteria bacterium]|nr:MAG: elongation factor G [Candidatus Stahlbacteria bacterium]
MAIKGIRTIGFFGHAGSGKTTIADAFLFLAGANTRFGKVSEKTSAFDCDPEEMERACSLNLGLATFDYKNIIINLIDTPGYSDFIGEAISGVQAVDCAVMVIDAVAGIEVGTERLLKKIDEKNLPLIFFINKLKKEDADYYKIFSAISEITKRSIVPLTIPIGEAEKFSGVADIIKNKGFGAKGKEEEIPAQIKEKVSQYTDKIIEAAADTDEALMNKYIEGQKIEMSECLDVMKKGITEGKVALCLAGDALELIGIQNLIDTVIEFMPQSDLLPDIEIDSQKIKRSDDSPFLGYVFKTTVEPHVGELCYLKVLSGSIKSGDIVKNSTKSSDEKINQIFSIKGKEKKETSQLTSGMIGGLVKLKNTHTSDTLVASNIKASLPKIEFPAPSISMAIVPKAKGDEEKVASGLARLRDEDPTFTFAFDPEIKQLIISGIGELHLAVILSRLERKYGVSVDLTKPRMKYRETFTKKSKAQGKYKKQTGGHGQYGDCWLRVEPLERGAGVEFVNKIVGGKIPSRYIPSVEKGVKETLQKGILAGYPITDIKVEVFEGSYHPVDSSDIAFKIAASMAIKSNAEKGGVVLLEPISEVEIFIPEAFMGDVMGDLNSRRGKIMGMEGEGKIQKIKALVPEAEMYKYSTSLRSMTQGRGYFNMKFHHLEEAPKEIIKRIVEEKPKEEK